MRGLGGDFPGLPEHIADLVQVVVGMVQPEQKFYQGVDPQPLGRFVVIFQVWRVRPHFQAGKEHPAAFFQPLAALFDGGDGFPVDFPARAAEFDLYTAG